MEKKKRVKESWKLSRRGSIIRVEVAVDAHEIHNKEVSRLHRQSARRLSS